MYDSNDFIKTMKQLAIEAVESLKPVNISFGKVISVSPLKVQIEQKLTLTKEQLVLSEKVTNYKTSIYLDASTTSVEDHKHALKGTFNVTVNNSLKINDEVILLRMQQGQKYIILDRIGG